MSGAKQFHKKEAARILIELRNKTEDERLMDYRRQLLQNDRDINQVRFNDMQDQLEQSLWPWAYPNPSLSPFNPNALPFGYPCLPNPAAPMWLPPTSSVEPGKYNLGTAPVFQGMDFQHPFAWSQLTGSQHQGFMDQAGNASRRRRTKFTNEQLAILEKTFTHGSKFPSPGERMRLETRTGLSKEKISVWFQNRRAKEKREKNQEEKETEETTTTDSENESEEDIQLHVCDETAEEESETETKVDQCNRKAVNIAHGVSSSPHASSGEEIPYIKNITEPTNIAGMARANNESFSSICDVSINGVDKPIRIIDVTGEYYQDESTKEDTGGFQCKRRKTFHQGQNTPTHSGNNTQGYSGLEYRLFGET